ncbi:MAG TPA: HD domain-containing phosphohydrolase [Solirubrobacteraceae bacterium]|nr:HD domain-containing phosphohydrolase [Solirubrobacteraceae bacterium]
MRRSSPRLACILAVALTVAAVVASAALADLGTWDPVVFGLVLILVVGAEFLELEYKRLSLSGSLLGIVIAMALLGPVQAAAIASFANLIWILRCPTRFSAALANIASCATFPLAGGVVMIAMGDVLETRPKEFLFAVAVTAGFIVAHAVNWGLTLTMMRLIDGASIREQLRTAFVPLLPSEAAVALLASCVVYAEASIGKVALGFLVLLFFLYLYLLRELLLSRERAELLTRRTEQLSSLQVGVLTAMLRTLSMRDRMTARHSAAVARYARELARAAGCTKEEQDLVHTAGLLHDIGKFILPDHILLADTKLSEEDWQLIKMHPYQGARVVHEVEGYGPVADIIWAHHERIDGRGYPRGLTGEEIPRFSRMISIADTYDVMTSRDSYRDPVSSAEAIEELRRVSDKQLDGELVEIFIEMLRTRDVAFRHADDADFEAELSFERRVRDHAAPRGIPAAA